MRTTTNIFGYNFICDASYEQLADDIISDVAKPLPGPASFITPNAHGINVYLKYPALNKFCQASRYVLPDGQPIVWLSRLTSNKIKRRLTGSDFFPVIFNKLKPAAHKCLFVVSNKLLKEKFLQEKPGASFIVPDFFNMQDLAAINKIGDKMADIIISQDINYVFIGVSEPKQGALAQNVSGKLIARGYHKPCIFFFLGASFEFYFGLKKRAPLFFQKTGLEWFYRLISEPKRMFKRYIFGNFNFILHAIKWVVNKKIFNL